MEYDEGYLVALKYFDNSYCCSFEYQHFKTSKITAVMDTGDKTTK